MNEYPGKVPRKKGDYIINGDRVAYWNGRVFYFPNGDDIPQSEIRWWR